MPVWTVGVAGGSDETVEAGLLATESGSLVALSEEGLLLRAWAPGQWRTVRHTGGGCPRPADRMGSEDSVLIGLPRG
jgi:hypothetical protein